MPVTDDPNDPGLDQTDPDTGMRRSYLVLSDAERARGFARPLRHTYRHLPCGAVTTMSDPIAETYARDPSFYGATFCASCRNHFPVGEHGQFVWDADGTKVGT